MVKHKYTKRMFWTLARDANSGFVHLRREGFTVSGFPFDTGVYHSADGYWYMVHLQTGLSFSRGESRKEAVTAADALLESPGGREKVDAAASEWLRTHEPAPGYRISTL